jgi:hypothetical protein
MNGECGAHRHRLLSSKRYAIRFSHEYGADARPLRISFGMGLRPSYCKGACVQ